MTKASFFLSILLLLTIRVSGQLWPSAGRELNYRIVGFCDPERGNGACNLEIAAGNWNREDSFQRHKIVVKAMPGQKIIAEVPYFGAEYTWRVVSVGKGNNESGGFHHFSTGNCREIDTSKYRVRITKSAEAHKDAYFFVDNTRALYDMDGKPVWYLPDTTNFKYPPVDLKMSPQGTITFLANNSAYEVDYDGNVLWKAPSVAKISGDSTERYHHQFSRLADGNYLAMGTETGYVPVKMPDVIDSDFIIDDSNRTKKLLNDPNYQPFEFGTLIEYDKNGAIVWYWKLANYFRKSDLVYFRRGTEAANYDMRENAFCVDQRTKDIYLSLKICSRILKIAYPSGRVIETYGEIFKKGIPDQKSGPFYRQHACNLSDDGHLYMYNNNMRELSNDPEALELAVGDDSHHELRVTWRYELKNEDTGLMKGRKGGFIVGGNVNELADKSMFVTVGGGNELVFVSRAHEILWSAELERIMPDRDSWMPVILYRASVVSSRAGMEKLVWSRHEANGR